jgi:enamine deaminase RidA (YjgF/YER057c/UK114 family)
MVTRISSGSELERRFGYSRAVVDGDWVFVSGTTGMNYKTGEMPPTIVEQAEQTFENIKAALTEAGAAIADILRYRIFVVDPAEVDALAPVFGKWLGDVRPASTLVITALTDPRMKIEIEVTARKGSGDATDG